MALCAGWHIERQRSRVRTSEWGHASDQAVPSQRYLHKCTGGGRCQYRCDRAEERDIEHHFGHRFCREHVSACRPDTSTSGLWNTAASTRQIRSMSVAPLREPSATPNSGSVTATEDQELVFGAGRTLGTFTAAGTNFTSRITPTSEMVEDMFVTATGSYSATTQLSGSPPLVPAPA